MKNLFIFSVLLFSVWVLLNASIDKSILIVGGFLSIILSLLFSKNRSIFSSIKISPKSFLYFFLYIFVLLIEVIKANFDVARRVIMPTIPINPGVVEVKTKLKSPVARLILANSITLTPGTLTVDIKDETLLVHWIDVKSTDLEKTTKYIAASFEKYLEVIYG
ncbi:MAG: Na+/H+ antiporter subunit E [Deltaproteobacteria bacterium]|nr:Na+/H+ antiporter subunit E [Deltaproteobacteria bacterium]